MKKRLLSLALCSLLTVALLAAPAFGAVKTFDFESLDGIVTTGDRADNTGGTVTLVDGKVGKAAYLDGTVGLNLGKDLIKGDTYTVAMWVKLDQLTFHTPTFWGIAPNDPIRWIGLMPFSWAEKFGVWSDSGDGHWNDLFSTKALPTGEWVHIAFTSAPAGEFNKIGLYLNGAEVMASEPLRDTLNNLFVDGGNFYFGVNYWDDPFKGAVDELYVNNGVALSAAQVKDLMDGGGSGSPAAPSNPKTGDGAMIAYALAALLVSAIAVILIRKRQTA